MKSLLIFILVVLSVNLYSQDWDFQKEVDGIKAYNRSVTNSKFKEYKVEAEIEGTLESIVSVLQDMDIYLDLFNDHKEASLIDSDGETHFEIFLHTKTPFPVKDRFTYSQTDYSYDKSSATVTLEIECLDTEYLRQQEDRGVLVTDCKGFWKIKDLKNGRLGIVHQFYADPEGMIPGWLINKRTVDSPIKSIKAIRKFIKKEEYQNRHFDFLSR